MNRQIEGKIINGNKCNCHYLGKNRGLFDLKEYNFFNNDLIYFKIKMEII